MFTFITYRDDKQKIIEEKIETLVWEGQKIVIPLNETNLKKYIKVKTLNTNIYWIYEFSQTDDINYLPPFGNIKANYEKGNELYIINPYIYKNDTKTNYKWFISFVNDNEEDNMFILNM